LSGEHFAAATVFLLAGAFALVWVAPDLASGNYLSPRVAAVTHLFTLGWLTLTILGALSQLLPVALGAPLFSPKVGHAAFWSFVAGIPLLGVGVAGNHMRLLAAGGTLIGLGVLLAVGNIAATLSRGRTRDVTWGGIAIGVSYLAATLVFGLILARNLDTGFVAGARIRILVAHLHIAIVGWAMIVIVGVSNRLLPMFLLAHGADTRWSRRALGCLATGVPVFVVGMVGQSPAAAWLGTLLLECGIWGFFRQAYAFYRVRVRKQIDIGMQFARASLGFFAAAAVMGPLLLALGGAHTRLGTAYIACGFLGGIVLFVTGFLYKIVPLLSWTARFGGRIGQGVLPTAADLYSTRVARVQLALSGLGIVTMLAGIAAASSPIVRSGTFLFLASVLLFAYQLMCVRWRTPPVLRSTTAATP
jgi:hypothetical protein